MAGLSITWFGHATFVITTPAGKRIVFDPWLTGNPKAPAGAKIDKADVVCLTHWHSDHSGDVVAVSRATAPTVAGPVQLAHWFPGKGLEDVLGRGVCGTAASKGWTISVSPAP